MQLIWKETVDYIQYSIMNISCKYHKMSHCHRLHGIDIRKVTHPLHKIRKLDKRVHVIRRMDRKIQPAILISSHSTSICKITVRKVQRIACLARQRSAE